MFGGVGARETQVRFEMFCWLFVVIVLVGGRIEGAIDVDAHIYLSLYFH